jgi:hypothetical protein
MDDMDALDMEIPPDTTDAEDVPIEDTAVDDVEEEEIFVNPYDPLELLFVDLETHLATVTPSICTAAGAMPIPSSSRRNEWQWLMDDLVDDPTPDWGVVWWRSTTYNFVIQPIRDPVHGDYIVVYDDDGCEGIYVFDLDTASRFIVQVPYPITDAGALDFAVDVFQQTEAWALAIAGADRCSDPATLPCDGQTSACAGSLENAHPSDAGLNLQLIFQTVHTYLFNQDATSVALQIQDMADTTGADIVTGDGTTIDSSSAPPGIAVQLRNALDGGLPTFSSTIVSCNDPGDSGTGYSSLCGEANVQGRLSNGSASPCGTPASASSERFIVLELSSSMLGEPTREAAIITAIDILF